MNERNYSVSGKERKTLVNKVAELTGEKPVYLGMPTVAFKIGPFEISRNGILSWEDNAEESAEKLIKELQNAGFRAEDDEGTAEAITSGTSEMPMEKGEIPAAQENAPGPGQVELSEASCQSETPANEKEQTDPSEKVGRREALMEQAEPEEAIPAASDEGNTSEPDSPQNVEEIPEPTPVNGEESTDEDCPSRSADGAQVAPESADHLTISLPDKLSDSQFLLLKRLVEGKETLFKHAFQTESLEVIRANGKISFPWFKVTDSDHTEAYTTFLTRLIKMAKTAKRVVVRDKPVDNEKFSFRVFMIRLGMIGDEYKQARKILMENLTGNSAWRNGAPPKGKVVESAKTGKVEAARP